MKARLLLIHLVLAGGLLASGCSPCGPANCSGCCDAAGQCQTASPEHCGESGKVCQACLPIQACVLGQCQFQAGGSGGGASGGASSGGSTGASTGATGSGSGSSGGSAGASSSGASSGGASSGGTTGTSDTCASACPRNDSSHADYTYICSGPCTGQGSVTYDADPSASCQGGYAPFDINSSLLDTSSGPAISVPVVLTGYAGGAPQSLLQGQSCYETPSPQNPWFHVNGSMDGIVRLTCPNPDGTTTTDVWGGTMENCFWVCTECGYYQQPNPMMAVSAGFDCTVDVVAFDNTGTNLHNTCTFHGALTLGGCTGGSCTH